MNCWLMRHFYGIELKENTKNSGLICDVFCCFYSYDVSQGNMHNMFNFHLWSHLWSFSVEPEDLWHSDIMNQLQTDVSGSEKGHL